MKLIRSIIHFAVTLLWGSAFLFVTVIVVCLTLGAAVSITNTFTEFQITKDTAAYKILIDIAGISSILAGLAGMILSAAGKLPGTRKKLHTIPIQASDNTAPIACPVQGSITVGMVFRKTLLTAIWGAAFLFCTLVVTSVGSAAINVAEAKAAGATTVEYNPDGILSRISSFLCLAMGAAGIFLSVYGKLPGTKLLPKVKAIE